MNYPIPPPEPLSFEGNVAENWKRWKVKFTNFLVAAELDGKDDKIKIATLSRCLGDEALDRAEHFTYNPEGDSKKYDQVIAKWEEELKGETRAVYSRWLFWIHKRTEGQSFEQYLVKLRSLASACTFKESDNMLRDKIVFDTTNRPILNRILREKDKDLTLEKVIEYHKTAEETDREAKQMKVATVSSNPSADVHALRAKYRGKPPARHARPPSGDSPRVQKQYNPPPQYKPTQQFTNRGCRRCGTSHGPMECPAYGKTCMKCGGRNHYQTVCKSRRNFTNKVHNLEGATSTDYFDEEDDFILDDIYVGNIAIKGDTAWFSEVKLGTNTVKMKLDTGAMGNVLPYNIYSRLRDPPPLCPSNVKIKAYGNTEIPNKGSVNMLCKTAKTEEAQDFFVVDVPGKTPPILGLQACSSLGLISRSDDDIITGSGKENEENAAVDDLTVKPLTKDDLLTEYKDRFEGLGSYEPYHLTLDDDAVPFVAAPRRIAPALHDRLKIKLDQMENDGVVAKVNQPTDFVVSPQIVEKKDGSLRICLDPGNLNKWIKREHFPIPKFEDVKARIGKKKFFTVFDQKDSYWQVPIDEESSFILTFNTPFGRYRFLRMPFGISSASEVLQHRVYKAFGDIKGVEVIADDMLVGAEDEETHDRLVRQVMERAREKNVVLNPKKIQYKQQQVKYFGCIIGHDGIRPDPGKVKAMVNIPTPADKSAVHRLLGVVNSFKDFIPNVSTLTAPIRTLLKKETDFQWLPEHDKALAEIKKTLTSEPVMRHFDHSKPVKIQADASSTGIGACLLQDNGPVAYASRALRDNERRWFQIEKEMLAVTYGAESFSDYLIGKTVEVENDHKPLVTIFNKPLHNASPRIQTMLMRLLRHQLEIKYVPGTRLYIADMLSRAHPSAPPAASDPTVVHCDHRIHELFIDALSLVVSDSRLQQIKSMTADDPVMQKLKKLIVQGWPTHRTDLSPEVKDYWNIRGELHIAGDLIFRGEQLVIPPGLRKEMLDLVHQGHLGMDKCKNRAKRSMAWPGMTTQIEQMIADCDVCLKYQKKNAKEPMIPHSIPDRPWAKVGMDIFTINGQDYLLIVDYYSKFPEACLLNGKTAHSVTRHCKDVFGRWGIPDEVIADNQPFGSYNFRQFARDWNFNITTASPLYPRSDGEAERFVGTVKQLMRKATESGRDYQYALLEYRNAPVTGLQYSPSQLLQGRILKDKLSTTTEILKPQPIANVSDAHHRRQQEQKRYHDRTAKPLPALNIGDTIRLREGKQWTPAIVTGQHDTPRSFHITTDDGREYRRNTSFLKRSPEPKPVISYPLEDNLPAPPAPVPVTPRAEPAPAPAPPAPAPAPTVRASSRVRSKPAWQRSGDFVVGK